MRASFARAASFVLVVAATACGLGVDFDRYARETTSDADAHAAAADAATDGTRDGGGFCASDAAFCTEFSDKSGWTREARDRCGSVCALDLVSSPVVSPPTALRARVTGDGPGFVLIKDWPNVSHKARVEFSFRADETAKGAIDVIALRMAPSFSDDRMPELRAYLGVDGGLAIEEASYAPDGAAVFPDVPKASVVDVRGRYVRVVMAIDVHDGGGGTCSLTVDGTELVPGCQLSAFVQPGVVRLAAGFVFAQNTDGPFSALFDDLALYIE